MVLNKKKTGVVLLIILLVIAAGAASYYFIQYKKLTKDPNAAAKKEATELVATVSKLILLPTGESPAIATVQDKDKLSSEPFFNNSLNGDKVLIYYAAKKAYLYRPSTNKIIEAAPINVQDTKTNTSSTTN